LVTFTTLQWLYWRYFEKDANNTGEKQMVHQMPAIYRRRTRNSALDGRAILQFNGDGLIIQLHQKSAKVYDERECVGANA